MSTTTANHRLERQHHAPHGATPASGVDLPGIAARFRQRAAKAATVGCPTLSIILRGYARLAADLAKQDTRTEWRIAWRLARLWTEYPEATATSTPYSGAAHAALSERTRPDPLVRDMRYTRDPVYGWFAGELPFNAIDDRQQAEPA